MPQTQRRGVRVAGEVSEAMVPVLTNPSELQRVLRILDAGGASEAVPFGGW